MNGWRVSAEACKDIPFIGPTCVDAGARDPRVSGGISSIRTQSGGGGGGNGNGNGAGGGTTDMVMCEVPGLTGVEPRIIQQRKCPPKTVMAINGMCYLRDALPAQLRMNKRRKAPVSYQDAQYIKKGVRASKRIKEYSQKSEKEYRKFVPRKKSTTTKRKR